MGTAAPIRQTGRRGSPSGVRTAKATDTYVTGGASTESYEPRFTFHGFRYAAITGVDPEQVDVVAINPKGQAKSARSS